MHDLQVAFVSWKYSPSIKYVLGFKFTILTADRDLVIGIDEIPSNMLSLYVYRANKSDKDRMWSLKCGEGRGTDFL